MNLDFLKICLIINCDNSYVSKLCHFKSYAHKVRNFKTEQSVWGCYLGWWEKEVKKGKNILKQFNLKVFKKNSVKIITCMVFFT